MCVGCRIVSMRTGALQVCWGFLFPVAGCGDAMLHMALRHAGHFGDLFYRGQDTQQIAA